MIQPVQGKIYAVSEKHQEVNIECEVNNCRIIIQPERFDYSLMCKLLEQRITIYAKGMEAAGLPVLMRAVVQYLHWDDEPVFTSALASPASGGGDG